MLLVDNVDSSSGKSTSNPSIMITSGSKKISFQVLIFTLTYISYAGLHFTREGWSILKSDIEDKEAPGLGWDGNSYAGLLDFAFLFAYSFGLFVSGYLGDNFPIRIVLPIGFGIVSVMTLMFSFGGTWRIKSVWYYMVFFTISGLCQSIGWPSYIAVMGNWFSKDSRGLVFGFWCTCQNIGNIGGNLLVNLLRDTADLSWMWSLRVIAIWVGVLAIFNFLLLVDEPHKVNIMIDPPEEEESSQSSNRDESLDLDEDFDPTENKGFKSNRKDSGINNGENANETSSEGRTSTEIEQDSFQTNEGEEQGISFWKAWLIPGVIPYAICIAFVKCSTYGMMLWLPTYAKDELDFSNGSVALIAIAFDVGTIFGSVILGKLSDLTYKKRSPVAFFGLIIGGVLFTIIVVVQEPSKYLIYTLIFLVGFVVGGVFNIVAATAAADLAKGDSLKGNDKALATVSGILDGSGSLGAAFGSLIIGAIRSKSWDGVFIFLAICVFLSSLPIFKAMVTEVKEIMAIRRGQPRSKSLN